MLVNFEFILMFLAVILIIALFFGYRRYVSVVTNLTKNDPLLWKKKTFLTGNELEFFNRLKKANNDRFHICPQVSMGALVDLTVSEKHPDYWDLKQKYAMKICDYVLCDKTTMEPKLVIELDDITHDFKKDTMRQNFLKKAGIDSLRFWSKDKPDVSNLIDILSRYH